MRNVEIKARLNAGEEGAKDVSEICQRLTGVEGTVLRQEDTFFNTSSGRLKLRKLDSHGELISYQRSDQAGPKLSTFNIERVELMDFQSRMTALSEEHGVRGIVIKTRTLHLVQQTRVHIDHVAGLGWFIELEVVLKDEQTTEEGEEIAQRLMDTLGIAAEQLISTAYIDLIQQKEASSDPTE